MEKAKVLQESIENAEEILEKLEIYILALEKNIAKIKSALPKKAQAVNIITHEDYD